MTITLFAIACWGWWCLVNCRRPISAFLLTPMAPVAFPIFVFASLCAHLGDWESDFNYEWGLE